MRRSEFLATKWDTFVHREDLTERERNRLRDQYAAWYWDAVGVPPDLRVEFRSSLESLIEQPNRTVAELVEEFRHRAYSIPQSLDGDNGEAGL